MNSDEVKKELSEVVDKLMKVGEELIDLNLKLIQIKRYVERLMK